MIASDYEDSGFRTCEKCLRVCLCICCCVNLKVGGFDHEGYKFPVVPITPEGKILREVKDFEASVRYSINLKIKRFESKGVAEWLVASDII